MPDRWRGNWLGIRCQRRSSSLSVTQKEEDEEEKGCSGRKKGKSEGGGEGFMPNEVICWVPPAVPT